MGSTALLSAALLLSALLLWLGAASAQAILIHKDHHELGATPLKGVGSARIRGAYRAPGGLSGQSEAGAINLDGPPSGGGQLLKHGGPVMHSVNSHLVYWDPGSEFTATTKTVFANFLTAVAHDSEQPTNVFAITGQYKDGTGSNAAYKATFAGAATDTTTYPTSGCTVPKEVDLGPPYTHCLTDTQLRNELSSFISINKLPTGPTQLYLLVLPHKVDTCFDQTAEEELLKIPPECSNNVFCAYHSFIGSGSEEIIYADIPFSLLDTEWAKGCQDDGNAKRQLPNGDAGTSNEETRFADIAVKYTSHEYIEAATDPRLNAWFDSHGLEIGDKCNGVTPDSKKDGIGYDANSFTPTLGGSAVSGTLFNQAIDGEHFYLQSEWDNGLLACAMAPAPLTGAAFSTLTPTPVAGSPVSFSGSAVDHYAGLTFSWNFGDGQTGTGAVPAHTYTAPGSYTVRMTPVDTLTGSTAAPVEHTVVVNASPSPPAPSPPAPSPPVASGASTGSGTGTPAAATPVVLNSAFVTPSAALDPASGTLTYEFTLANPGTFSWLFTFPNGKFGAFASQARCRAGQVRLAGRCRPAKVLYAKGRMSVGGPGVVKIKVRPGASALKALKTALKQHKGVPVSATFTFQSAVGGLPVAHTVTVTVKLKRR